MLRLWTDRVRIYLHPEQVVMVRQSGLLKRRIITKRVIPVDVAGELAWSGALTVLETALKQAEWHNAKATVILSNHFVKYRVALWNASLTEEERIVLLRHQFIAAYGDEVKSWPVAVTDGGYGKSSLACAVDGGLTERLQRICAATNVPLMSIQPYLMTAFNCWRQGIDPKGAWFILVEQSYISIAFIQHGVWRVVRGQCYTSNSEIDIELLLVREALQLGVDATGFTVHFFSAESDSTPNLPDCFKVQVLHMPITHGYLPQDDRHIAAALCA